ncbi:MAG: transposase, partial [Armatimonadota bacterium]|nr:transposase [Armatimonadota bacterium]
FANIKSNKGLSRFSLRGMMGAKSEFWLACMAHNLMICVRKMAAARLYALCAARIAGLRRYFSCWLVLQVGAARQKHSCCIVLQQPA